MWNSLRVSTLAGKMYSIGGIRERATLTRGKTGHYSMSCAVSKC
jgi:heme/copper-type cytochrome/quinol oxidase subunit 2